MSPCFDLEFLGPTMRLVPIAVAVRARASGSFLFGRVVHTDCCTAAAAHA